MLFSFAYFRERIISKVLNPFWSVLFLAFICILAVLFRFPQGLTMSIVLLYFLLIVSLNPINGVYFLFIIVPFLLGNSKRPYYLMIEFFVYTTICSAFIHWWLKRPRWVPSPLDYPVLLFLAVSLCSLPVNLKELLWEMWAYSPVEFVRIVASSHEGYNPYYVRVVLNLVSGVSVYYVIRIFSKDHEEFIRVFKSVGVIALITVIFGFLFRFNVIPHKGTYLTLSLVGRYGRAMTAFAYNQGYLGQYLAITLPLIMFFALQWKRYKALSFMYFLTAIGSLAAIGFVIQRGPVVALVSEVLLFFVLYQCVYRKWSRSLLLWSGFVVVVILIILIVEHITPGHTSFDRLLIRKFKTARLDLWKVDWQMFLRNPLLGIGLGKHHYFFPYYADLAGVVWRKLRFARTTAHNTYFNILAEQGIVGLGCFILLIGTVFKEVFKKLRIISKEARPVTIAILISLFGWLAYGISQNMFYLRCMQIYFWIVIGFLAVILKEVEPELRFNRRHLYVTGVFLLLLFTYRVYTVIQYPYPEDYCVGFYRWEVQQDGERFHWMRKRAAMRVFGKDDFIRLKFKAALPGLDRRPQRVYVTTSEGVSKEVLIRTQDPVVVRIPVKKKGRYIWLRLKTRYIRIPAKEGWSTDTRRLGVMVYEIGG